MHRTKQDNIKTKTKLLNSLWR